MSVNRSVSLCLDSASTTGRGIHRRLVVEASKGQDVRWGVLLPPLPVQLGDGAVVAQEDREL